MRTSIFDIELKAIDGSILDLHHYEGKYILFVNVASKCGFTPQYKGLQKLYETYQSKLVVIGVPCNQFGNQEPGNPKEIESFCDLNYGVTFPISEKLNVKGSNQHALYQWLTKKAFNGKKNSSVKWNFQKYLIDEKGEFIDYFFSMTAPNSSKIIKYLKD